MRIFAVADEEDVLTGLRLAGIAGRRVSGEREAAAAVEAAQADPQIAVLLITESCAALIPETVTRLRLSSINPLLVVIPGTRGSSREADAITRLIREAIGIRI
ncbi:MAG: V-type ATP synthase subunit F [Oscillospiraceae bacterium]|jgi:V/A-type H+-transporting ATPase subunit F|nr:V-type ATP synthase subunit F [Oscillospiraceae bacterium]